MLRIRLFLFILLLVLGLAHGAEAMMMDHHMMGHDKPMPEEHSAASAHEMHPQEISIIAKRFEFMPKTVTVAKSQPVKIYLTSVDATHGFYLEDFKVNREVKKGELTVIEFTPDKTGEFQFRCSVFCGLGHGGMQGKLIVQ